MAVYTSRDNLDLGQIADRYHLENLRIEVLAGGAANSSFKAITVNGTFVLTVLDNYSDKAAANLFATHTESLFQLGIPTARVVRNVDGERISMIDGRPLLLKEWIEGNVVDPLPDNLYAPAGALVARLHKLPPEKVPDLPVRTRRLSPDQEAMIADFQDREFASWLSAQLEVIRSTDSLVGHASQVISHGDVFSDNLLVRPDGTLAIIDWETVSFDDAILDLGMTLLGLAKINGRLDHARAHEIVSGYLSTRRLSEEELHALPVAVVHAAVIIGFHRYRRHNVRFPDETKSRIHLEMVGFVESVQGFMAERSEKTHRPAQESRFLCSPG